MEKFIKDNWFKLGILIILLLTLIFVAYYFLFFKQKQALIKSNKLSYCLEEAENDFQEKIRTEGVSTVDWCTEDSLRINPYQTEGEARIGCVDAIVGGMSANKDDKISTCYKKYPQN